MADEVTETFVAREATKSRVTRAEKKNERPFRGNWTEETIKEAKAWLNAMPSGKALKNRLASGGAGPEQLRRMIDHRSGASEAYKAAAVDSLLQGGDAAMLYGDPAPFGCRAGLLA
jgi:hypothetical protein